MSNDRKKSALIIISNPHLFKICEGCDSILKSTVRICPNCKAYKFNLDIDDITDHAVLIGNKEQTTVTKEDLF